LRRGIQNSLSLVNQSNKHSHHKQPAMLEDFELTPRVVVALVAFLVSTLLVLFTQPNTLQQRRSALRSCTEHIQKLLAERCMHGLFLRLACLDAFTCDQFHENGANGRSVRSLFAIDS
jgi:hypothetical protein